MPPHLRPLARLHGGDARGQRAVLTGGFVEEQLRRRRIQHARERQEQPHVDGLLVALDARKCGRADMRFTGNVGE